MRKTIALSLILGLLLVGSVSAISADYYYHPECGHCQKIVPFMKALSEKFDIREFNTAEGQYNISGTPTMKIHPGDDREIILIGSGEIPAYSECELNEMSTQGCRTYSADTSVENSWFIR